ncbi:hypothetical protein NQ315_006922 [Exocentrus adspersus]|uniref:C2HC/C3H-type domain-containing protein n=1 Tax=Exocentrus adspersus TaxID=1586481 RepID=A0AAV8WCV4_9CUCU|nr:hypothetical protein NQ315_006922 [Exocentrus adspersus]
MKLKTDKRIFRRRCKPFLVLPALEKDSLDRSLDDLFSMTNRNNPGLKLFTKTWTPKGDHRTRRVEELSRPLTATLEKPMILDISLVSKIDMSKIRKEFLNISNLCKVPLILKSKKGVPAPSRGSRPLSLPPPEKHKHKKKRASEDDSFEDEESTSVQSARKTKNDKINARIKKGVIKSSPISDANNNKTFKVTRKCSVASGKIINLKSSELIGTSSTKLPEPCTTCGRPDQPERFHSHPATPMMRPSGKRREEAPKIPVKSTVQKPVAIKYKSKTSTAEKKATSPTRKPNSTIPVPSKAVARTPPAAQTTTPKPPEAAPRARSAKRTLTCYLCGREFGTASLSLHEPKCLEKWERENATLPPHLRRKPPPKPDHSVSKEEWNKVAWEASQSTLAPCQNCGRTFYPDRLLVHQRSCKLPQNHIRISTSELQTSNHPPPMSQSTPATPSGRRPPSVECYICGKMFGSTSIKIHEKQCLKKWNIENDSLPAAMRSPPPTRNTEKASKSPEPQRRPSTESEKEDRPKSARKPPLFPCYICGKLFTVNSIYIHEPQCLKMWKVENEKLPPRKRRPQPLKPDIKFTRDGKIDFEATNEAHWQSHLSQLVPCKNCARTFNPDRVEVHERSCKGF